MKNTNEYTKQAQDFLKETNTTIEIEFDRYDYHFTGDKDKRDIYNVTIKRGDRSFTFKYGNSIVNSGFKIKTHKGNRFLEDEIQNNKRNREYNRLTCSILMHSRLSRGVGGNIIKPTQPTEYDILSCLTKYNPELHENFCDEYDYDVDSIQGLNTYNAVQEEYNNVCMIWNSDEVEQLAEIN